ncbi:MAG: ribonuclease HII [Desulfurococcales archaeon]|nr:ribonuclease HII [Desulfurococcales archaeon]MCE4605054.1 ribonuclease HII [Desulfurococcales archaeon]
MHCQGPEYAVGVDEAGRGSLVGEMIVAGYAIPVNMLESLLDIGVRDSKDLTPASRRRLYRSLADIGVFSVYPVPPTRIDSRNLASLTEEAIYHVLHRITSRIGPKCVSRLVIDRYGTPRRITGEVARLGLRVRPVIQEKADARYPEVGAASIIAKHVRDARIEVIRRIYGIEGSGYPSDPRTVESVMRILGSGKKLPVLRYSWGTLRGTKFYKPKRRPGSLEDFM